MRELGAWLKVETGYPCIQGTHPQTRAYAVSDSPVGLNRGSRKRQGPRLAPMRTFLLDCSNSVIGQLPTVCGG
jgi:hypothetical protein